MKFDTKVVRAGISPDPSTGAIVPPIYQSATYVLEEVGKDKGYDYTRASNPTREILENNLASLDGGKYGICFSSGMAAVDYVMKIRLMIVLKIVRVFQGSQLYWIFVVFVAVAAYQTVPVTVLVM